MKGLKEMEHRYKKRESSKRTNKARYREEKKKKE